MFDKFLKKVVKGLKLVGSLFISIGIKIEELSLHEEYYVYVPNANKPRVKHSTYNKALREAERLQSLIIAGDDIEILQVIDRLKGTDIPF